MKLLMENWKKYLKEGGAQGHYESAGAGTLKYYRHLGEIMIVDDSLKDEHEDYWALAKMVKDLVDNNMLEGHTFPSVEASLPAIKKSLRSIYQGDMLNHVSEREAEDAADILRMDLDVIERYLPEGVSLEDALAMWAKENGYGGTEEIGDPAAADEPSPDEGSGY